MFLTSHIYICICTYICICICICICMHMIIPAEGSTARAAASSVQPAAATRPRTRNDPGRRTVPCRAVVPEAGIIQRIYIYIICQTYERSRPAPAAACVGLRLGRRPGGGEAFCRDRGSLQLPLSLQLTPSLTGAWAVFLPFGPRRPMEIETRSFQTQINQTKDHHQIQTITIRPVSLPDPGGLEGGTSALMWGQLPNPGQGEGEVLSFCQACADLLGVSSVGTLFTRWDR
jgi:hypothetical protein